MHSLETAESASTGNKRQATRRTPARGAVGTGLLQGTFPQRYWRSGGSRLLDSLFFSPSVKRWVLTVAPNAKCGSPRLRVISSVTAITNLPQQPLSPITR